MILLIDAYNVLKQVIASDQATMQEKTDFIDIIRRYASVKNVKIELVFDGGSYGLSDRVAFKDIIISHSGAQESADDVIKSLICSYKGRDLLLVSTDRELGRYASLHGVQAIDSIDFYRLVRKAFENREVFSKKSSKKLIKMTKESDPEVDALMAEYTINIKKGLPEELAIATIVFGKKKVSKRERRLEKKIRKL